MADRDDFVSLLLDDTNAIASMSYTPLDFQNETGAMMHAVLWGAMANVSYNNLGYDSIVTNLLKDRTLSCLGQIQDDSRPSINGIKKIL